MSARKLPFIMSVVNANSIYGQRFNYPHEVVKYENALEKSPHSDFSRENRMTCPECNTFKDRAHIQKHLPHSTLEGM